MTFPEIDRLAVDPASAQVFEHGWQSWSPTTVYDVTATSHRPVFERAQQQNYRPHTRAPETGFQGEGLLVVDDGRGGAVSYSAESPTEVPSIRAVLDGDTLTVSANGPVRRDTAPGMDAALRAFGDRFAAAAGVGAIGPAPTVWCSWYHYFSDVTEADMLENLDAIGDAELPIDVVQLDEGWEGELGDWLTLSDRFESLTALVERIRSAGRRAGVWVAPFLAGERSELARRNPYWLSETPAGHWLDQHTYGVDPVASWDYQTEVFTMLREAGFDYFKLDFLYAGVMASDATAYREGLAHIRDVIGPESYLLLCGAPILPSVGLCDAMRIGPDIAPTYESENGDPCEPSQFGAAMNTLGRSWQHGRFWVNDPDCLIARPEVERRAEWAATVEAYGGLRSASDRIAALDEWGMDTTRRLLSTVPAPVPFDRPGGHEVR